MRSFLVFALTAAILCGLVWGGWAYLHRDGLDDGGFIGDLGDANGSKLTLAITGEAPQSLDIRTDSSTALDQALLGNVYETLLKRTTDNGVAPGIASSWSISDDGLTYTFQLNGAMHFANGDTLDATDVVDSLRRSVQNNYAGTDKLDGLSSVSGTGADTVVITLSKPNPDLPWLLSGRPGIVYDSGANVDYATHSLGSGPFSVKSFEAGKSLTLQRNANYWNTSAAARSHTITLDYFADANLAATAMAKGETDLIVEAAPGTLDMLRSHSDITLQQVDSTRKVLLGFNGRSDSMFSEARMRQGVRYAINHQAIVDDQGAAGLLGGPISSLDPGYEDLTGLFPYDFQRAYRTTAYFIPVFTKETKRLVVPTEYAHIADMIANDLNKLDLGVRVEVIDDATWRTRVVEQHDFDMTIFAMNGSHDVDDLADPSLFLGYTDGEGEEFAKRARAATNDAEYADRLKTLARRLSDNAAADFLYVERPWIAYRNTVTGVPTFNRPDVSLPLETLGKA